MPELDLDVRVRPSVSADPKVNPAQAALTDFTCNYTCVGCTARCTPTMVGCPPTGQRCN
ncbi:hypothetical protein GCM10012275_48240 [Longimycelium tulufanense]|uniref:Uncharacterized protein n=1 Tax=Longimycelium tulufanense TaxID=907463 RepID=A0A8J3CJJ4_9PSEU|nr:hypothetical protein GCM10012275_48240 [Longimycelium tulufanense]